MFTLNAFLLIGYVNFISLLRGTVIAYKQPKNGRSGDTFANAKSYCVLFPTFTLRALRHGAVHLTKNTQLPLPQYTDGKIRKNQCTRVYFKIIYADNLALAACIYMYI